MTKMTWAVVEHSGSYDDYRMDPIFSVVSEEEAKKVVDLLNEYAAWIKEVQRLGFEFARQWDKDNPDPWTRADAKELSRLSHFKTHGFAPSDKDELLKKYEALTDKRLAREAWVTERAKAGAEYKKSIERPEKFSKLLLRKDLIREYWDDLSYGYYGLEVIDVSDLTNDKE
jgi:hypothetical protein